MTIKLSDLKKYYIGLEHQKKTIIEFGNLLLKTPAKTRLGLVNPSDWILLSDEKLNWLQNQLSKETLESIAKSWRQTENKQVITPSINWDDMNSKVSKYFTVREVTNNQTNRIPTDEQIKVNIIQLAKELDKVREMWGSPIRVTSWYRPPAVNRAVRGASNSQHLTGKAVDIAPVNGNGIIFENWLDKVAWKDKALGYGQKASKHFTHIDLRPGRIRWNY